MPKSQVTIHRCPFDSRPCDNYICRRSKRADGTYMRKYFVGDPEAHGTKPVFCEDCIQHLVNNLPPELVPGGDGLEERIHKQLQKEFEKKLKEELGKERARHEMEIQALRALLEKKDEKAPEDSIATDNNVEEDEEDDVELRCIDCNETFTSAAELIKHRKKHKNR